MLRKFGLIGYPLSHSFSPSYFAQKFDLLGLKDHQYEICEAASKEDIIPILKDDYAGLNVTIPYKEKIISLLDTVSDEVISIGAVNTLKRESYKWVGYNTDVYGFRKALTEHSSFDPSQKALILGTGGAAKAIKYVLDQLEIPYILVSRQSSYLNYEELNQSIIEEYRLIINTTPLGTFPNQEACPNIPYKFLSENHYCFDLVYNPEKSLFLNKAHKKGAAIQNGYKMLTYQAEKSWEIWNQ